MAHRVRRLAASLLVTTLLLVPAAPVHAEAVWDISVVNAQAFVPGGTQLDMIATCPSGRTPISGGYDAGGGDVRHEWETTGFGSGLSYQVGIDNEGGDATVTATVYCVPTSYFPSGSIAVYAEGTIGADHLGTANARCDNGYYPLNASIGFTNLGGATVVASVATTSLGWGWSVRGWHEVINTVKTSSKIYEYLRCVPTANVAGWKLYEAAIDAGWGTLETATCPSGGIAISGGATQDGSDGQGIVNESHRSQANQWSARMMSLSGGQIRTQVICIAGANLQIDVTGAASPKANSTGAVWTVAITDPAAALGYGVASYCRLWDPNGGFVFINDCATGYTGSNLVPDGEWRLEVNANSGDGRSAQASWIVLIDTTAPTVAQSTPAGTFTYGTSTVVKWSRSDTGSGVASQRVRSMVASLTTAYGPWTTVTPSPGATSRTYSSLVRGSTYCFGVRAYDNAGNVSPWTASRCTAIPLDDRDLTQSTGTLAWTAISPTGWYRSTALKTSATGATLTISGTAKHLGLAALTCPTCGMVEVWVGSTKVATVNLYAATTARKTMVLPVLASPLSGTIKIKVISTGKLVQVDALGVSRN